jgi:dTDP-4-amino-4,6-dideoxygalactose transaminase
MIVTGDRVLADRCRALRNHGIAGDFTAIPEIGFNYRLTDFQAALGLAQMARFDEILAERRRLARRYDEALTGLDWLTTPAAPDRFRHSYQSYVCLVEGDRDAVAAKLAEQGIMTRPGTHALPPMECFPDCDPADFPNTTRAAEASLAIPLFAGMTGSEQDRVIDTLCSCQSSS